MSEQPYIIIIITLTYHLDTTIYNLQEYHNFTYGLAMIYRWQWIVFLIITTICIKMNTFFDIQIYDFLDELSHFIILNPVPNRYNTIDTSLLWVYLVIIA
jgi:hypothetical protein